MPNIQDLIAAVYDVLDDVDLYYKQVYVLKYDNTFKEFDSTKGRRNYDKIIKNLKSVSIPDPEEMVKKTMDLDSLKSYLEIVLRTILGDGYEEDIKIAKSFIKPTNYQNNIDVKTEYKDVAGIETASRFIVSKNHNPIQLALIVDSEVKVLLKPLYKRFNSTITNIHYQKLPGFLAAYIAIYELSELLKQENLVADYEDTYIYNSSEYAKGAKDIIAGLPDYRKKSAEIYQEHSNFSQILTSVYNSSLIEKYLEDKKSFLSTYRKMIKGDISIPAYLEYYGISLTNREVLENFQNRINTVEKRYELK